MELGQAGMSPGHGSVFMEDQNGGQNPMKEVGSGQPVAHHYPGCPLHVALLKVSTNYS